MEKLKVASLFCGCGGMDLGILGGFTYLGKEYKKNPFEIVYSVDNDNYCTKIYNENFAHKCIVKDVRDIEIEEIPDFDMLIGGFPCQSFSISAQNPPRLGYKDERGMLFFEMVKILKERQPRFFIAENVKGLLSANKGQAFPMIMREFKAAGYTVVHKLLNAYEYGVPQKRERVIIVGFRDIEDYYKFSYPCKVRQSERKVLRDVISTESDSDESLFFSDKAVAGMMAVREKMNKGRAMQLDEPCNTISAHLAKVSLNSTDPVYMVGERYRRFSAREAARIQSFPDSFDFDSVSQVRQYKAIGNAVPPVMMWHVANTLINSINSEVDKGNSKAYQLLEEEHSGEWIQFSLFEPKALYITKRDRGTLIAYCSKTEYTKLQSKMVFRYKINNSDVEEHPELLKVKHLILHNRDNALGYFYVDSVGFDNSSDVDSSCYLTYELEGSNEDIPHFGMEDIDNVI